ncbi:MAG: hypothetical protein ACRD2R_08895 [Terriglobales bacterium]
MGKITDRERHYGILRHAATQAPGADCRAVSRRCEATGVHQMRNDKPIGHVNSVSGPVVAIIWRKDLHVIKLPAPGRAEQQAILVHHPPPLATRSPLQEQSQRWIGSVDDVEGTVLEVGLQAGIEGSLFQQVTVMPGKPAGQPGRIAAQISHAHGRTWAAGHFPAAKQRHVHTSGM